MAAAFPASLPGISAEVVDAYVDSAADVRDEAFANACEEYRDGRIERDNATYVPSGAELAARVRVWEAAIAHRDRVKAEAEAEKLVRYPLGALPPPRAVPLGPLEVDYGHGKIDMREMSHAEKEAVLANRGRPMAGQTIRPQLQKRRD